MTCSPLLLARYLDNRLSDDELLACLDHAHACHTCRQALMEVRRYERSEAHKKPDGPKRAYKQQLDAPQGFAGAVLHRLEQVRREPIEPPKKPAKRGRPRKVKPAVMAATQEMKAMTDKELELRIAMHLSNKAARLIKELGDATRQASRLAEQLKDYKAMLADLKEVSTVKPQVGWVLKNKWDGPVCEAIGMGFVTTSTIHARLKKQGYVVTLDAIGQAMRVMLKQGLLERTEVSPRHFEWRVAKEAKTA